MGIDNIEEMLQHLTSQNTFLLDVCDKLSYSIENGDFDHMGFKESLNQRNTEERPFIKPMQNPEIPHTKKMLEYEPSKQMQQLEAVKIGLSKRMQHMDAAADYGIFQEEIDWMPDALSLYKDLANIHAAQLNAQMKRSCDDNCGLCNLKGRIDSAINQLLRPQMKWENDVAGVENARAAGGEPTCPEGYMPNPEAMRPPFPRPPFPPGPPMRSGPPMQPGGPQNADDDDVCPEGFMRAPGPESMPPHDPPLQNAGPSSGADDDICPEGFMRAPEGFMGAPDTMPPPPPPSDVEPTMTPSEEPAQIQSYAAASPGDAGADEGNYDTVMTAVAAAALISAAGVLLYCKKNNMKAIPQQFNKLVAGVTGSGAGLQQRASDMCKGAAASTAVNKVKNIFSGFTS